MTHRVRAAVIQKAGVRSEKQRAGRQKLLHCGRSGSCVLVVLWKCFFFFFFFKLYGEQAAEGAYRKKSINMRRAVNQEDAMFPHFCLYLADSQ